MMEFVWNPWHGCKKYSEGCQNCYMHRSDISHGRDPEKVYKTQSFNDAVKKKRDGSYKFPAGARVMICLTSDFFLDSADEWREEIWQMVRLRSDVDFYIITKRITRFMECIPPDWGEGYPNVAIGCTVENQKQADIRLPVFREVPVKRKELICEPLLGEIDLRQYLDFVSGVTAGGESGKNARECDYRWILSIRDQCAEYNVPFWFKQTGARFRKDGKLYNIERRFQHSQARRACINIRLGEIRKNETEKDHNSL